MTKDLEISWGLAAIGRSGDITIEIDQACSGPVRWELSINHLQSYFRFMIAGPPVVGEFLAFLQRHCNQSLPGELVLGSIGSAKVSVIKDVEFVDRFFLCVASADGAVRYTLNSAEIKDYVAALKSAMEDLDTVRVHSAFLNSYSPEDDGLYGDTQTRTL